MLAVRFGVEVTYERRYEGEIRGWLRRHPHDYRDRQRPRQRSLAVQRAGSPGSSPGGRWRRSSEPYFDEVIGAAQSGLFDTLGHLDFAGASRPRCSLRLAAAPELYEPVSGAHRGRDGARGERVSCASRRGRPILASIVRRYRELGGRNVTIGSDGTNRVVLRRAAAGVSSRDGAGFEALAFRRGAERVLVRCWRAPPDVVVGA